MSENETVREKATLLYICLECGSETFVTRGSMFAHHTDQIDCPECGHTISEVGES